MREPDPAPGDEERRARWIAEQIANAKPLDDQTSSDLVDLFWQPAQHTSPGAA